MVLSAIYSWHTVQLDYVGAYPQAPVEQTLYMQVPKGCQISGGTSKEHVLRLKKNVYGQKLAGKVWNDYLVSKLTNIGFVQSNIDQCVFYRGSIIYVL